MIPVAIVGVSVCGRLARGVQNRPRLFPQPTPTAFAAAGERRARYPAHQPDVGREAIDAGQQRRGQRARPDQRQQSGDQCGVPPTADRPVEPEASGDQHRQRHPSHTAPAAAPASGSAAANNSPPASSDENVDVGEASGEGAPQNIVKVVSKRTITCA